MSEFDSYQGIIFEGKFQKSLMYFATSEGFASPTGEDDKEDVTSMLSDFRKANKRTQALDLCLIYDKIYLYDYTDAFDISGLIKEGLVEALEPADAAGARSEKGKDSPYFSDNELPTLLFLKPIILPYLQRRYPFVDNSNYEKIISLLATEEFTHFERELMVSLGDIKNVPAIKIPPTIQKSLTEVVLQGISREAFYTMLHQRPVGEREKIIEFFREAFRKDLEWIVFFMFWIFEDLFRVLDLLKKSAALSVPIAASTLSKHRNIKHSLQAIKPLASVEQYYKVFEIIVNEVEYFPRVDSLGEVLKLRNDKRIIDFRNNLRNWAIALRDGNATLEEKLRREISKSNQALCKLGSWKKAGAFITYTALPLSILPILGLPMTMISVAIQLYINSTEWRNRWLMVGR